MRIHVLIYYSYKENCSCLLIVQKMFLIDKVKIINLPISAQNIYN